METAVVGIGQIGTLTGTVMAETVLVAAAVVLGALLLVVRVTRANSSRKRKAAGAVYFDRDAAHYGPSGRSPLSPGPAPPVHVGPAPGLRRNAAQLIAPSFTASRTAHEPRPAASAKPHGAPAAPNAPAARSAVGPPAAPAAPAEPASTGAGPLLSARPPAMAEPPIAEPDRSPALAPLPSLRPKGTLPADLPAMPAPPPSGAADAPDTAH